MADTEHFEEDKRCTLFDKKKSFCQRCSEFHSAAEWMEHCERYLGAAPIRRCKTCGGDHPLDRWPGNCMPEPNWNRSDLPSPQVIQDSLPDIINPVTGKPVDSKRALRKQYKEAGVEEVGDDHSKTPPSERQARPKIDEKAFERDIIMDVKKSIEILKSDNMSNDQMTNMIRAPAEVAAGFTVD